MYYKHYFICGKCKTHLTYKTDVELPISPGRTHWEALENGADLMTKGSVAGPTCLGVMSYCAGFDKMGHPCGGNHKKGTDIFQDPPAPPSNPDWDDFVNRVNAAWQVYVNSGYAPAHRGPNHDRSYKVPNRVSAVLQASGGMVQIGGGYYSSSTSLTSEASLKRNAGNHHTFIFHL
jgi:hypothetical protein